MADETTPDCSIVLNPVSGSGDHANAVRDRAALLGYDVLETEGEGDAIALAREAAEADADIVAAAGGDGTLNEVVRGVDEADALERTVIAVVPTGTGNNFAGNVGITTIDEGFHAIQEGERRDIDLGVAGDSLFVNSCVSGLTADASSETDPELKSRFGVLAYVLNTLQTMNEFEGLGLKVDVFQDGRNPVWNDDAILVLVGNGRRFSLKGNTQANMEDGLFDVTVVENAPTSDLVEDALLERLVGQETEGTVRIKASALELVSVDGEPVSFSLDGEIVSARSLSLTIRGGALTMPVGDKYDPQPVYDA